MAFFKNKGQGGKVVEVNASIDIKEWEAAGYEQCDKDGKPLAKAKK